MTDNKNDSPQIESGTMNVYDPTESGASVSPWGDGSSLHKPAVAVKFTPASYPITIKSVDIYVKNQTGNTKTLNLQVFTGTLSAETPLFSAVSNISIPVTGTSSDKITVSIPQTQISSGSFYIAIEWVDKPLSSQSGANSFFVCTDNKSTANKNFLRYSGTNWYSVEEINAPCGDFGIEVLY